MRDGKDVSEVYAFGGTPFNTRTAPLNKRRRWVWRQGFTGDPAAADPGTDVTLGWDVMGEEYPVGGTVVELPFLPIRRAAG